MTDDERRYHMQLVHTLAHYIHEGGEYEWEVTSHLKSHDLEPGQELHTIRIDDVAAFAGCVGGSGKSGCGMHHALPAGFAPQPERQRDRVDAGYAQQQRVEQRNHDHGAGQGIGFGLTTSPVA
jgi:hypothetical protein